MIQSGFTPAMCVYHGTAKESKMKIASLHLLTIVVAVLGASTVLASPADEERTARLKFVPVELVGSYFDRRNLKKSGRSGWGYFTDDFTGRLCVANIDGKVKMDYCELNNKALQWEFDSTISGDSYYLYTGLLRNRADKRCVRVKGSVAVGQKLEMVECDDENRQDQKQFWLSDGDGFGPRLNEDLCTYHKSERMTEEPERLDPVVLKKCKNTFSMDFGDLDDYNLGYEPDN